MALSFVSEKINEYCENHSTVPSQVCRDLENHTREQVPHAMMLTGPLVGSFLGFLASALGAKRVLEVGTFTGYSALCLAERTPANAEIITLDVNEKTTAIGQSFWDKSPHGKKIRAITAPALATLEILAGPFDFVFIDADKVGYLNYLKNVLPKLSSTGVVVADNTLWSGRVLETNVDADTRALQEFNDWIKSNPNLESTLVPIRDGLHLIRKK